MDATALTYHDVLDGSPSGRPGPTAARYKLDRARFAAHLDAVARHGRPALLPAAGEGATLLTFDDGGASALTSIAPLLESHGFRGHFFVITGSLGGPAFLDDEGVRELAARGHLVGSHTETHPDLRGLDDAALRREWADSRERLEEVLGGPVSVGSVPYGLLDDRVVRAAADAGYRVLFTSDPRTAPVERNGVVLRGRFGVVAGTSARHVAALCRGSRVAIARERIRWGGHRAATRTLGPAYAELRRRLLATLGREGPGRG